MLSAEIVTQNAKALTSSFTELFICCKEQTPKQFYYLLVHV